MNNLKVIENKEKRVLTTKQLAECYNTSEHNIIKNLNENKDRFKKRKHYYKLD